MNVSSLAFRLCRSRGVCPDFRRARRRASGRRWRHLRPCQRQFQTGDHRRYTVCKRAGGRQNQCGRQLRFRALDFPPAAQSGEFSRDDRRSGRPAEHGRLEDGQRAIRVDRPGSASGRRACRRAIPLVGHGDGRAGRRRAIRLRPAERAPHRAHDCRRGVHARDRREGILRFPRHLRRRKRPQGEADTSVWR